MCVVLVFNFLLCYSYLFHKSLQNPHNLLHQSHGFEYVDHVFEVNPYFRKQLQDNRGSYCRVETLPCLPTDVSAKSCPTLRSAAYFGTTDGLYPNSTPCHDRLLGTQLAISQKSQLSNFLALQTVFSGVNSIIFILQFHLISKIKGYIR